MKKSSPLAAAPAVAVIVVASVLPLAWMLAVIVANPAVRGELRLDRFRAELLGRTVAFNAAAAAIATLMGLPAGYVLGRGRGVFAKLMWVVLPAALLMPSLSYAYGWSQVVRILSPHLPFDFHPDGPADRLRCIWSLAAWLWAIPATLIGITLRRLDTTVQQQALLDGGLRRVTFRQLLGPIIASLCIVTVLATQEFAVYEPTGISVVATEVRMVFDTGAMSSATNLITASLTGLRGASAPDQAARAAAAVTTCLPLLLVTTTLACVAVWAAGRSSGAETLAVGDWPRALDASLWTVALTIILLLLNVGVPVAALVGSLRFKISPSRIWNEFSPQLLGAMFIAAEAALVALIVSFFSAARWVRGSLAVTGASFLVGGQLLAIALIRIYNRPGLSWAEDTATVIAVVAYLGRFGWLAVAAGRATWARPWRDLRDMASLDGASDFSTALHVVWPLAWPVLLAGGLLVGALSLTEVPATVLLMPQNPQVLTPSLMTWVHMIRYDAMIEASLLMMAAVLLPAVAAVLLTSFGLRVTRRSLERSGRRA